VTSERLALVWANFHRYRRLAEELLIPEPENVERAAKKRAASRRLKRSRLTLDDLADVAAEYRSRRGQTDVIYEMAEARGINRSTLRRQLEEAERQGLIPEGLPRRGRSV
jgi:hypothetical protein